MEISDKPQESIGQRKDSYAVQARGAAIGAGAATVLLDRATLAKPRGLLAWPRADRGFAAAPDRTLPVGGAGGYTGAQEIE